MQNIHLLSQFIFHYYGVGLGPGMRIDPFTLWLKTDQKITLIKALNLEARSPVIPGLKFSGILRVSMNELS